MNGRFHMMCIAYYRRENSTQGISVAVISSFSTGTERGIQHTPYNIS